MENVEIIVGGKFSDARGALRFCNEFDMTAVKRFYTISSSAEQPRRGWIGHKRETKWFFPLCGITKLYIEPMDGGMARSPNAPQCYTLDAAEPKVLRVPANNWFCIEQDGSAELQVFSNCRVGEFKDDDFRRPL